MIKAIIFDLGGIIVFPEVEEIQNYIADYIGVNYYSFHEFFEKYNSNLTKGKILLIDVYSAVVEHFNLKDRIPEDIVNKHLRIYQRIIKDLNEEALNLVENLKQHYILACLINTERDVVPLARKRGIFNRFQYAFISTEMGMRKPDPEIYLTALESLKCIPEETVFIDDKEMNVAGAKKLGIHTILYKTNSKLKEDLLNLKIII